jgi:hypothetical protein
MFIFHFIFHAAAWSLRGHAANGAVAVMICSGQTIRPAATTRVRSRKGEVA